MTTTTFAPRPSLKTAAISEQKIQNDTRTEYKATVRNCAESGTIYQKYFIAYLLDKSGTITQISSRKLSPENPYQNKYVDTFYKGDEDDIYYAILNYPAMEADGITLQSFSFAFYVSEGYDYTGDAIAVVQAWFYDLIKSNLENIVFS